ncbi:MAG: response regulator transcription factor [Bacteroidetes bacterium]|nr:response regulator transcription factor [Bacteroidota bacterium]
MSKKPCILLVEDDLNFGAILKSYLELNEFLVIWRTDGKQAWSEFFRHPFDLCILDVMMPEMDGFTLAKEIRDINSDIPVIFLTAKTLRDDILEGFRLGADDYITKPFDSEVLLFKIRAILKRSQNLNGSKVETPDTFEIGKYFFNYKLRQLKHDTLNQSLTPKEAELLRLLCLTKNDVLYRKEALLKIWGDDSYFTTRSMDVFITKAGGDGELTIDNGKMERSRNNYLIFISVIWKSQFSKQVNVSQLYPKLFHYQFYHNHG